jgi:c-di-GMP-binding flagellar brake protein YcgR
MFPRQEIRLEVKIPTATMLKVLWTVNISRGGMSIEMPAEVKPGTRVLVMLTLPNGELLELPANVKHSTPKKGGKGFFVGVQFGEISDKAKRAIEQIISTVKEFRKKNEKKDLFEDSDIDID